MWIKTEKRKPEIGDCILVKTSSGQVFYAVYTNDDEFDVHRPTNDFSETRAAWYKYSSRTVIQWRKFQNP